MKMAIDFKNRDIISITDFTRDDILYLCQTGKKMHDLEKSGKRYSLRDALSSRALSSMFYEPSTRTRTSFNTAMRELGGQVDGFSGTEGTSVMKKETIRDTVVMMDANHFDAIVMRHPLDGSLQWAADVAKAPVINGGDGKNEHPTQSLLDMLTVYLFNDEKFDGLEVGFGGDLAHGRTVRSLSLALSHFDDITIRWAAKDFLGMPDDLVQILMSRGVKVVREERVEDVLAKVDFYDMTRPQLERMEGTKEDKQKRVMEVMQEARITEQRIKGSKAKLMHPLPVNSEIAEIEYAVYFLPNQIFFPQAEDGPFMRKGILYEMLNHDDYVIFDGRLSTELKEGNNRLERIIKEASSEGKFIDDIPNGTVLDHLKEGTEQEISQELDLVFRGYDAIPANIARSDKAFIKTNLEGLDERELKKISIRSPEPTVNYIKDGNVADKFVYLLCRNDNCISKAVNEDVPPKFYNDEGTMRCRYCRKPYEIESSKVSAEERQKYMQSLPDMIKKIE